MKRLLLLVLAAGVLSGSGCHLFSSKKKVPKESKDVASDVEKDFMHRWIEKRTAELVASGHAPAAAHDQAVQEYKSTYSYTRSVSQAN